jgi:GcrA cell cycle regulator
VKEQKMNDKSGRPSCDAPSSSWTEARVALLTRLWMEGVSAAGIARALGEVSRSAVLGKLQRLKLLKTRKAASAPRVFGQAVGEAVGEERLAAAFTLNRTPRREPPPSPWKASAFRPLAGTAPGPWLTRAADACAFPVGGEGEGTLSCCAPCRRGSPYCTAHHTVVYRPTPPLSQPVVAAFIRRAA